MADNTATLIDFPLLKLVSDARSTYGLRHHDYARYKSHCTAKLHHLRKSVGLTQTAAKTRKYQKKEVAADKVTGDKHLQIVLFDAERCWAQAQLLKASLNEPTSTASTKHHVTKRLAKAASHALALVALSRDPALAPRLSAAHTGQIQAYHLVLSGALAFERSKHDDGLRGLSAAYVALETLARTAESATDEALAHEAMDEVEPMLRFCAYRLGRDTAAGVAPIAEEVAPQELAARVTGWEDLQKRLEAEGRQGKKETVEVRFRGEVVPVRNAELVGVAVKVKAALEALEKDEVAASKGKSGEAAGKGKGKQKKEILGSKRMSTYDRALMVLSDAEVVASQLVEDNKIAASKAPSLRSETSTRPLTLFHAYITYHLLSLRTKRDLLLIASARSKLSARESKLDQAEAAYVARTQRRDPAVKEGKVSRLRRKAYPGLVKVFDGVLLSLEAMRDLEVVEEDDELATAVEARIAYVRAERCKYLALAHALADDHPSALTLTQRAQLYSRQSRQTALSLPPSSPSDEDEPESETDFVAHVLPLSSPAPFDSLDTALAAQYDALSRAWLDANGGRVGADALEEGMEGLELEGPKKEKVKGRKPAFYDVAFSYVTAFDMDAIARKAGLREGEEEEEEEEEEQEEQVEEKEEAPKQAAQEDTPTKSRGWGFGLFGRR
ncbi:hypothetical protein JCM10207_004778 [Rhodosporidiobolus poonsookiae]